MNMRNPINPTDDTARTLARQLLDEVRFGALAVGDPKTGSPYVARAAMLGAQGGLITLISTLSKHTAALQTNPACSVLIGEPEGRGDPLTHPRMTCICTATLTDKRLYRAVWLAAIPKAKLYYDFTDFMMFRLTPSEFHLNGGFGKAFHLTAADLE
jgi:putative heme iron utilization protein